MTNKEFYIDAFLDAVQTDIILPHQQLLKSNYQSLSRAYKAKQSQELGLELVLLKQVNISDKDNLLTKAFQRFQQRMHALEAQAPVGIQAIQGDYFMKANGDDTVLSSGLKVLKRLYAKSIRPQHGLGRRIPVRVMINVFFNSKFLKSLHIIEADYCAELEAVILNPALSDKEIHTRLSALDDRNYERIESCAHQIAGAFGDFWMHCGTVTHPNTWNYWYYLNGRVFCDVEDYKDRLSLTAKIAYARTEERRIQAALSALNANSQLAQQHYEDKIRAGIQEVLNHANGIIAFFEQQKQQLSAVCKDAAQMMAFYEEQSLVLKQNHLPKAIDSIDQLHAMRELDYLEHQLAEYVGDLENDYLIYRPQGKKRFVDVPLEAIVKYSSWRKLRESVQARKAVVIGKVNKSLTTLRGIEEVYRFNWQAAVQIFDNNEPSQPEVVAFEGLDRCIQQVAQLVHDFEEFEAEGLQKNKAAMEAFCTANESLKQVEQLNKLKLQLAKARTKQQTQALLEQSSEFGQSRFRWLMLKLRTYTGLSIGVYKEIQRRIGLEKGNSSISLEVSALLDRSRTAMQRLPYVYRQLFSDRTRPQDGELVGRVEALEQLHQAFERWQNKQVLSISIHGEPGSGKSSLLDYFVHQHEDKAEIKRLVLNRSVAKPGLLLVEFNELLGSQYGDWDELIEALNTRRIIIVVENLEQLYLRAVGGYALMKQMLRVMQATSDQILWLCSCDEYAWNYMSKAYGMDDFFNLNLNTSALSQHLVKEAILDRHMRSGYRLEFLVPANASRKVKESQGSQRQELLQEAFFERLSAFAKGNLSIAMMYWIFATVKVEENTLYIETPELNFDFLNSLSAPKVFTINALLHHHVLNAEEHAAIFNQSVTASDMHLRSLRDDGILVAKKDGRYEVHLLLYRSLVNQMKAKNLIH